LEVLISGKKHCIVGMLINTDLKSWLGEILEETLT